MATKTKFELAVERVTGETVDALRQMPVDERRRMIERKAGRAMRVLTYFPFVGRGMIIHDRVLTHEQVENELRKALR